MLAAATAIAATAPAAAPQRATPSAHVERIVGGPGNAVRSFWQRITGEPARELFVRPYGVAWDGEDLLVADPGAGRVLRIDPKGRAKRSEEGLLLGPIGIASCPFGIVVSDSRAGALVLLDRDLGLVRSLATDLGRPTGVACSDDEIFVVDTARHRVIVLDSRGTPRRSVGRRGAANGEFNYPAALSLSTGALWVGDTLNFRIQHLDGGDGSFVSGFGSLGDAVGDTPRVKGIAVDRDTRIWITDAHLDRILLYAEDGTFLADVGRPGTEPGEVSFPAGIAVGSDGRVAVADSLNRRVQVFRLEGTEAMR